MAQILSIYGLVAAVIISGGISEKMPVHTGFLQLGAGLAVGLCGMAAGFAIGIVGDAGGRFPVPRREPPFFTLSYGKWQLIANCTTVRGSTQQPRLYVGMVLILIFAEVLGLYGVIVSILMITRSTLNVTECPY